MKQRPTHQTRGRASYPRRKGKHCIRRTAAFAPVNYRADFNEQRRPLFLSASLIPLPTLRFLTSRLASPPPTYIPGPLSPYLLAQPTLRANNHHTLLTQSSPRPNSPGLHPHNPPTSPAYRPPTNLPKCVQPWSSTPFSSSSLPHSRSHWNRVN